MESVVVPQLLGGERQDDDALTSGSFGIDVGAKGSEGEKVSEKETERTDHLGLESIAVSRGTEAKTEMEAAAVEGPIEVRPFLCRLIYGLTNFTFRTSRTTSSVHHRLQSFRGPLLLSIHRPRYLSHRDSRVSFLTRRRQAAVPRLHINGLMSRLVPLQFLAQHPYLVRCPFIIQKTALSRSSAQSRM